MEHASHTRVLPRLAKVALAAFVGLTCLRVWTGAADVLPRAEAQIPDAGTQRIETNKLIRETNRVLAEILTTLQEHTIAVKVTGEDKGGVGDSGGSPSGGHR